MILLPAVRDGWCAFTLRYEGRISWLYQDVRGFVTTGLGCLVDPVELALPLPWQGMAGPATQAAIRTEWERVKALPPALLAGHYKIKRGLWLRESAIDDLALTRLDAAAGVLQRYFPDLGAYPAPAQQALMSMCWAMGPGFPPHWPRLSAAVRARDWNAAAAECSISTVGNPGVAARNKANMQLFKSAAGG